MFEKEEVKTETINTDRPKEVTERPKTEGSDGGSRPFRRPTSRPSNNRRGGGDKRKFFMKKKVCFFCKNKDVVIDYKDVNLMRRYVAESGKIVPRRFSGTCAKHQRKLSTEIKKARQMALIPYTDR